MDHHLLPFPILDGGTILFLLIEGTLRRDLNQELKERVYQVAFVMIVVMRMVVVMRTVVVELPTMPVTPYRLGSRNAAEYDGIRQGTSRSRDRTLVVGPTSASAHRTGTRR